MGLETAVAVTVGTQLVSGILAEGAARGDRKSAKEAQDKAIQVLLDAGYPPDIAKPLLLKEYKAQGIYTPELEQQVDKSVSEMGAIKENKEVQDLQMNALRGVAQRAQGGLTPEDRVAMMELQDQMAQQAQQQNAAIQQNMQQRGISGGGAELAAQLSGNQGALQQGAQGARQLMADQSRRALEALAQQGQMSGNIRTQDFANASAKAQAADSMNRFNVQNQMAINAANTAAKNRAKELDYVTQQDISNKNTGLSNAEIVRQNDAKMDMYNAELVRRGGQSRAYSNQAKNFTDSANATAGQIQGIGNSLAQGYNAYNGAKNTLSNAQNAWDNRSGEEIDADIAAGKKRPDSIWSIK